MGPSWWVNEICWFSLKSNVIWCQQRWKTATCNFDTVINIFFSPSNSPVFYPGHFPLSSLEKFREPLLNNGYPCVRLSRLLPRGLSTIHSQLKRWCCHFFNMQSWKRKLLKKITVKITAWIICCFIKSQWKFTNMRFHNILNIQKYIGVVPVCYK